MPKVDGVPIHWLDDVAAHDYDAAYNYLSLRFDDEYAEKVIEHLRHTKVVTRRVNDILRATGLTPAALDDPGVKDTLIGVLGGKKLSPVLFVCGKDDRSDIADGYHRVSLVYRLSPFASVPLRMAEVDS